LEKQKLHAWIYVAGLLLVVLDGFVGALFVHADRIGPHDESSRAALLEVLVLMLPYWAGFLVAALKGTWRNSLAAFAASWMIVPVVVWFLMFAGRALNAGVIGIFLIGCFALFVGFHAAVAAFAFRSLRGLPGREWGLFLAVGYCVFPLLLHAQVPNWRHLTPREGGHPIPSVEPAMQTLTLLDKCSLEVASRNTSKIYPESLSEFGSAKLGCLPDAVANQGYADGYHYSYSGTSRNELGQVTSYEARARWTSFWLNGVFELYTNQNAVFLWSETGDALTKGSPPVRMAPQFDFGQCLVTFERSTPFGQKQIPVTDELVLENCFRYGKPTLDDGTSIWHIEMRRDASQNIDGFTLRVRPRDWGVTGFRSYLVEMDFWPPAQAGETPPTIPKLTTHSTIENRDATGDDPVVWSWWHEPPVETRWTDSW